MTTLTKPKPQTKQPKTKKTTPKNEVVFTKEDFLAALDKVIAAPVPIPQEQNPKKQPEKEE